jgi:hypothetical protein
MAIAGRLLDELDRTSERQERTRALRAQYLTITQAPTGTPIDYDSLIATVLGDGEFNSMEAAAPVLLVLRNARRYPEIRNVIDSLKNRLGQVYQSRLDCILAAALASSHECKHEEEAVSIYERLLSNETDDSDDMKHNLAILLNSHDSTDFDGRAYKIWKEVYLGSPTDFAIRKAFARY